MKMLCNKILILAACILVEGSLFAVKRYENNRMITFTYKSKSGNSYTVSYKKDGSGFFGTKMKRTKNKLGNVCQLKLLTPKAAQGAFHKAFICFHQQKNNNKS